MPRQKYKVKCTWCHVEGHNERTCEWKNFVEECPQVNQLMEERTQAEDIPPYTQESQPAPIELEADDISPSTREYEAATRESEPRTRNTSLQCNQAADENIAGEALVSHFLATNIYTPSVRPPRQAGQVGLPHMSFTEYPRANIKAPTSASTSSVVQ